MSSPRGPPELVLDVDGMMCQKNCATTVRIAIKQCKNVEEAVVTYANREALVWGKNLIVNDIINEIENVGYGAVVKDFDGRVTEDADNDPPDMILSIKGMFDISTCPDKVNRTLMTVDGVVSVVVDFGLKTASIWGFADTESLISALSNAGYVGSDPSAAAPVPRASASPAIAETGTITFNLDRLRKAATNPSKIESSLAAIPGVFSVNVDSEASRLLVSYNSALISTSSAKQVLAELNYMSAVIDSKPALEVVLSSRREINFEVTGMSCANCALKIEKYLSKAPGVVESGVSCMTNKARVVLDERQEGAVGPRDLMEKIQSMGYGCELLGDGSESAAGQADRNTSASTDEMLMWWRLLLISLLFGLPVMCLHLAMSSPYVMMMSMTPVMCRESVTLGQVTMFCLNLPILLFVGYRYYKAALLGAMHGNYGMDCLVTTGTSITFIYSSFQLGLACQTGEPAHHVFFETTGMLLMFVTVGKYIEAFAKGKSVSAITNLLQLQPREALLVVQIASRPDSSASKSADVLQQHQEVTKTIPVDLVQRGDLLKVLPGQGIPTDGKVESGTSYVNESMITGESIAVMKSVGDLVFGSTVNQNGCLYIRVTSLGSESALAQIVKLVETAQMSKAPVQAYADRVAGMFTPVILLAALLTFAVWYSLSVYGIVPDNWFRQEYNDPLLFSMLFAISVVVISCPCALGLATPTAIMFGTSVGAANGILIKGGSSFEMAHRITTVVFDKTGTLTEGRPSVSDEIVLDDMLKVEPSLFASSSSNPIVTADVMQRDYLLRMAATAEQRSEHPLATAVLEAARSRAIPLLPLSENAAVSIVGNGVSCSSDVGRILVGNRGLMEDNNISVSSALDSIMWDLEVQGKTAVCVAVDERVIGVLGIADVPKEEAVSTVKALRGLGVDVWMLTGDSRTTAEALADELEIPKDRVMAGILPSDKVNKVSELQAAGRFVAMVGDGVNDSPALAQSDLGVAIGTGTQVAIEAADMVLIRNNLHDLVVALDLAKVVFSRIKWNFMWAIIYNAVAIPYAAGIFFPWTRLLLPPQYAGLAMALSSISVVLSSMALRFYKRPNLSSEVAIQKVIAGSMYDKAKRRLTSLKNSIKEKVIQATGKRRGSGPNYQQLPRDEMEADESLGLELGLGGLGGLRRNSMADDSDGIV